MKKIKLQCPICRGAGGWQGEEGWEGCDNCREEGTLPEVKKSKVKTDDKVTCEVCKGDGGHYTAGTVWHDCPTCSGRGFVRPPEAVYEASEIIHPRVLIHSRYVQDRIFLSGVGLTPADIMFVGLNVSEFETKSGPGREPSILNSRVGDLFKMLLNRCELSLDSVYFTYLVKWLVPLKERKAPKKSTLVLGRPCFENELKRVAPEIIVCLGKRAFDQLWTGPKFKRQEMAGAWFQEKSLNAWLYLVEDLPTVLRAPESMEAWISGITEVRQKLEEIKDPPPVKVPTMYRHLKTLDEVSNWLTEVRDFTHYSMDCEWGHRTHVHGPLRSVQFCWAPGQAVYIEFFDEKGDAVPTMPLDQAGELLRAHFNKPDIRYIGHDLYEDFLWVRKWLGFDVWQRAAFDTSPAQQCLNEHADLGLKRMAMFATDLGRYDLDLFLWKKENPKLIDDVVGYRYVPTSILFPYACSDVDAPFRMWAGLDAQLKEQELTDYYYNILLPYATDFFSEMSYCGIPMDRERMDQQRATFLEARSRLEVRFRRLVAEESLSFLVDKIVQVCPDKLQVLSDVILCLRNSNVEVARALLGEEAVVKLGAVLIHAEVAPQFNIRSTKHMRRWLYEVKRYTPIKSTANKGLGMPAVSWEKVLRWSPARQSLMSPSTDLGTLLIFRDRGDKVVKDLVNLNLVGNVVKSFLKPADEDGTENGLHQWVAPDERIHCHFSLTDTSRPRSWNPNVLNWTAQVEKEISEAVGSAFSDLPTPPPVFPLRSCAAAPEGYCFVETDLKAAEMVGLAYLSGDTNLIDAVEGPDPQFGMWSDGGKTVPKRVAYADRVPKRFRLAEYLNDPDDPRFLRTPAGGLVHPLRDIHWETTEDNCDAIREQLEALPNGRELYRNGLGKPGNFQILYGATPSGVERKIEQESGRKPPEGTGQRILESFARRFPVADAYLRARESEVAYPGYFRAISGRIRHWVGRREANTYGDDLLELLDLEKLGMSQGRVARNFPMQNHVADHMAIVTARHLLPAYRALGWAGWVSIPILLYDSISTLCPIPLRFKVEAMHRQAICQDVFWKVNGREFHYGLDAKFTLRWSVDPVGEDASRLKNPNWNTNVDLTTINKLY